MMAADLFCGAVTVGERGQVVIPAAARRELGIAPGDRLLVFRHPFNMGVVFSKIDTLTEFLTEHLMLLEQARTSPNGPEADGDCMAEGGGENGQLP